MSEQVSWEELRRIVKELSEAQKEVSEAQKQGEVARQQLAKQVSEAQQRTEEAQQRMSDRVSEAQQRTEEAQQRTKEAQQRMSDRVSEAQQRTEAALKEVAEAQKETEKMVKEQSKNLDKASGNFTRKWGAFLEGFVKGNLIELLKERKIKVDRLERRREIPSGTPGESLGDFDLVALNGKEIVVIEVKTTLTASKLEKFLSHLEKFKSYFPEYEDRIIYGGVAYMNTDRNDDGVGERAMEEGLFAIVAPGGNAKVAKMINPEGFAPKKF